MGRKRTSTKKDLKLFVDKDVIEKLNFLKVNKSVLFTEAAEKLILEMAEKEKNSE